MKPTVSNNRAGYRDFAGQKARAYGIPEDVFIRQLQQESGFNPRARSPKGALGIGQFMPGTGKQYGLSGDDFYDPYKSIDASARHMRDLIDNNNGDINLALAAYNAGQGAVNKYGGIPPFRETRDYVAKITGGGGSAPGAMPSPMQQKLVPEMSPLERATALNPFDALDPVKRRQHEMFGQPQFSPVGPSYTIPGYGSPSVGSSSGVPAAQSSTSKGRGKGIPPIIGASGDPNYKDMSAFANLPQLMSLVGNTAAKRSAQEQGRRPISRGLYDMLGGYI
jgi:hypothetical protein